MKLEYVPESIRNYLSDTIIESLYNSYRIQRQSFRPARYQTPANSFELSIPHGHAFLNKAEPDGGRYEPLLTQELRNSMSEETIYYDIGARFGYHAVLLSEMGLAESQIHVFETDNVTFHALKKNLSSDAQLNNMFVSDHKEDDALDSYIKTNPTPDIVKIDVEGAEAKVIAGLSENLDQNIKLYVEVHPEMMKEFNSDPSQLVDLLRNYEYMIQIADHRQSSTEFETISDISKISSNNYLLKAIK